MERDSQPRTTQPHPPGTAGTTVTQYCHAADANARAPQGMAGDGAMRIEIEGVFRHRPGICRVGGKAYVVGCLPWVEVPFDTTLADLSYVMAELVVSNWTPPKKKKRKKWSRQATAARRTLANVARKIEQGGAWGKVRKPVR